MTADVAMKTILIHKKPLLLNKRGFNIIFCLRNLIFCKSAFWHFPHLTVTVTFLYTPLLANMYIVQTPLPFALITPSLFTVATLLLVV